MFNAMTCKIQIPSVPITGRSGPFFSALLLAGMVLLGPGWGVQRCAAQFFPGAAVDEPSFSIGVFQLTVDPAFTYLFAPHPFLPGNYYYPGFSPVGGVLTSPILYDFSDTLIAVSKSHVRNTNSPTYFTSPDASGVRVGTSAVYPAFFPDFISNYSPRYANLPPAFANAPNGINEIMTEIESFNLATTLGGAGLNCPIHDSRVPSVPVSINMVVAGPAYIPGLPPNRRSIGMVQQLIPPVGGTDFPAQSFFDIFVEVTVPQVPGNNSYFDFPGLLSGPPRPAGQTQDGAVLYNDANNPLVIVNTNVTSLPPTAVYIHGVTLAVPLRFKFANPPYWAADEVMGYLVLAGHGVLPNPSNDCAKVAAGVTTVLDQTLGPVGSPLAGMPVPWLRPANTFPTPNSGYGSVVNTFVDPTSGITNVNDDTVSFPNGTGTNYIRDISLGNLLNPIPPPPYLGTNYYNPPNTVATMELSVDGLTWSAAQASGPALVTISNTSPAGSTASTFDTEMLQLNLQGNIPLVTTNPSLPVVYPDGTYRTPQQIHATFHGPELAIVLTNIEHRPFGQILRDTSGSDEFETFNSQLLGQFTFNGSPSQPINGNGQVHTVVHGKVGNETGTFQTEMLSMNLTASTLLGPVMIRESPTLSSLGQTSITGLGGGLYQIDSFFDVFTELSIDNGQTWIPADNSVRVQAVNPQTGSFMIRESPTKQSLGKHTIRSDPRGFNVSSFFDVFTELSTNGGQNWIPANRSIRLQASVPPAVPGSIFISQVGTNVVLQWQNNFTLQSTPSLLVPFTDVAGPVTSGIYSNVISGSAMFFRLRN